MAAVYVGLSFKTFTLLGNIKWDVNSNIGGILSECKRS